MPVEDWNDVQELVDKVFLELNKKSYPVTTRGQLTSKQRNILEGLLKNDDLYWGHPTSCYIDNTMIQYYNPRWDDADDAPVILSLYYAGPYAVAINEDLMDSESSMMVVGNDNTYWTQQTGWTRFFLG